MIRMQSSANKAFAALLRSLYIVLSILAISLSAFATEDILDLTEDDFMSLDFDLENIDDDYAFDIDELDWQGADIVGGQSDSMGVAAKKSFLGSSQAVVKGNEYNSVAMDAKKSSLTHVHNAKTIKKHKADLKRQLSNYKPGNERDQFLAKQHNQSAWYAQNIRAVKGQTVKNNDVYKSGEKLINSEANLAKRERKIYKDNITRAQDHYGSASHLRRNAYKNVQQQAKLGQIQLPKSDSSSLKNPNNAKQSSKTAAIKAKNPKASNKKQFSSGDPQGKGKRLASQQKQQTRTDESTKGGPTPAVKNPGGQIASKDKTLDSEQAEANKDTTSILLEGKASPSKDSKLTEEVANKQQSPDLKDGKIADAKGKASIPENTKETIKTAKEIRRERRREFAKGAIKGAATAMPNFKDSIDKMFDQYPNKDEISQEKEKLEEIERQAYLASTKPGKTSPSTRVDILKKQQELAARKDFVRQRNKDNPNGVDIADLSKAEIAQLKKEGKITAKEANEKYVAQRSNLPPATKATLAAKRKERIAKLKDQSSEKSTDIAGKNDASIDNGLLAVNDSNAANKTELKDKTDLTKAELEALEQAKFTKAQKSLVLDQQIASALAEVENADKTIQDPTVRSHTIADLKARLEEIRREKNALEASSTEAIAKIEAAASPTDPKLASLEEGSKALATGSASVLTKSKNASAENSAEAKPGSQEAQNSTLAQQKAQKTPQFIPVVKNTNSAAGIVAENEVQKAKAANQGTVAKNANTNSNWTAAAAKVNQAVNRAPASLMNSAIAAEQKIYQPKVAKQAPNRKPAGIKHDQSMKTRAKNLMANNPMLETMLLVIGGIFILGGPGIMLFRSKKFFG